MLQWKLPSHPNWTDLYDLSVSATATAKLLPHGEQPTVKIEIKGE
jgi:hypothetical protein